MTHRNTVRVSGLRKSFGSTSVLRGVDLDVVPGQVHALLGANGAGKSTLIKCLSGAVQPDAGMITIDGQPYRPTNPRAGLHSGISVIYQQFSLVPALTVAENIFLGGEFRRAGFVLRRRQRQEAKALLARLGVDVDVDTKVSFLPVALHQLIEIAKAVHRDARLVVLDEPTASLSNTEAELLVEQVKVLESEGRSVLYVTHLLGEVFRVAREVTVLRDGAVALHADTAAVTQEDLIRAITGRRLEKETYASPMATRRRSLLQVKGLRGRNLGPLDLDVARGEIVGVFGLLGSGRTELLETLFGRRARDAGEISLEGHPFSPSGPGDAIRAGVGLVPGERARQSILASQSLADNLLLPTTRQLGHGPWRNKGREQERFRDVAKQVELIPPDPRRRAWTLSGGNQQKLAVGRWLVSEGKTRLLLLDDPTQGIDVSARRLLYRVLRDLADGNGVAVLFTTSTPEEIGALAHRAVVLHEGRKVAEPPPDEATPEVLLTLANNLTPAA